MSTPHRKNRRTGLAVLSVVLLMTGLSFASVPLYNLFCRVTGYGGTTQVSQSLPETVLDRTVTIRFNADTAPGLLWDFRPDQSKITLRLGAKGLTSFTAENKDSVPIVATALYNVSPPKAGRYFHKIQCFCFGEQALEPGQAAHMPVMFYVDPAMNEDKNMADVTTITLSYTFFKTGTQALDRALEDFYDQPLPDASAKGNQS